MRCLLPFVALLFVGCDPAVETSASSQKTPPAATKAGVPVTYSVVRRWTIPNGGEGQEIVIAPPLATEEGMTALAQKLWYDTRAERNAFVWIYDDIRAAKMAPDVLKRSKSELLIYDRHFVGTYMRNINTGFHHMSMHPQGLNSPTKQVDL